MKSSDSKFIKVRCADCENEQVLFNKASTIVYCHICGTEIAVPSGGKAKIKGEILEVIE
jgi:small subunit ribosomal protein S27e